MKLNALVVSMGAALYSVGSAYAATANTPQPLDMTLEEIKAYTEQVSSRQASLQKQAGVNVHVNRQAQQFKREDISGEHVYLVRLRGEPVAIAANNVSSDLGKSLRNSNATRLFTKGRAATRAVEAYKNKLLNAQQGVLNEVAAIAGVSNARHHYTNAINGFSVKMTEQQAEQVAALGSVVAVTRSKNYELLSDQGPTDISADKIWSGEASPSSLAGKGEGQIIGIIDSGINSDHPSFADVGGDGYDHTNPWGAGQYVGDCVEDSDQISCNDKLIGVRSYDIITDAMADMIAGWPAIGEDYSGHGSHVASTAAGNVLYDIPYMVPGFGEQSDGVVVNEDFFPMISGVAPHANIVSYQACFPENDFGNSAGCPTEALVAAVEDAISDGVDVINYSIGGADKNVWGDAVQLAFLSAREAGISVAAAAGNSGQECGDECFSVIDNSSPWLAQVAATTHSRKIDIETKIEYAGFAADGNGSEVPSWSQTGIVGGALNNQDITGVVVWAKDYADVNGDTDRDGYCTASYPAGTFDFYKDGTPIEGAASGDTNVIVVCQRHLSTDANANARTAKVDNVKAGGADAFIMFNRDPSQGTVLEGYSLPGVHLTRDQWLGTYPADGLEDWVDSTTEYGHQITIKATVFDRQVNAENKDWLAPFSSRGPSIYNPEVLAPSIAAPGVNVFAAYSDEHPFVNAPYGTDYSLLSGTSMASPHIAGSLALMRQQQPQWSPSEIQSALMMTTDNTVQYRRLNKARANVDTAEIYRAGAGRVNVAKAVQAGLVMDESAENFKAADPNNGGVPHRLNLPYLINFACKPQCQWIRTVKATKDGTWELSHGDTVNWNYDMDLQVAQAGVDISYEPQRFSLKAGETQSIVVKARVLEAQTWITNSEVELHSELFIKEVDGRSPDARLPMIFKYDRGELPTSMQFEINENQGSYRINDLNISGARTPYAHTAPLVKATVKSVTLPKDNDKHAPYSIYEDQSEIDNAERFDESTITEFIDVPENTSRLIAQVLDTSESSLSSSINLGFASVFVGKDYNGNGQVDPQTEILCYSTHGYLDNFCNLQSPEPGKYWVVIHNPQKTNELNGVEETFEYAIETVPATAADNASISLVDANTGTFDFNWDMELSEGDVLYTQLSIGTSEANPENLWQIPVKIVRGEDRITLVSSHEKALLGDQVSVALNVKANNSGADRDFTMTMPLPEGLDITLDDVTVSMPSIMHAEIVDQNLVVRGTQPDSSNWAAEYVVTDNVTDQHCKTPSFGNAQAGGYVDLNEFGITPMLNGFDESNLPNYKNGWAVPAYGLSGGVFNKFSLFNNLDEDNFASDTVQIRGNGQINLSATRFPVAYHIPFSYNSFPYKSFSALWRGQAPLLYNNDIMSVGLTNKEGISIASTQNGWVIIEWDNAADYGDFTYDAQAGQFTSTRRDNSFDFEVIFTGHTHFAENQHEMYFAYDNLDFGSTDGRGVAGLQGYKGMMTRNGPISGFIGNNIISNTMDESIHDGYVICLDYRGPESSQMKVNIDTTIPNDASGKEFTFDARVELDSQESVALSQSINVNGNITLAEIENMTTPESTAISFDVLYADELGTANDILVEGEHVTATVEGNSVTLMPETDFHGDIDVTVTVSDVENPTDKASTTFVLTVESDGVEPVEPEPEVDSDDSSSGSIAWYLLALAGLAVARKKRITIR